MKTKVHLSLSDLDFLLQTSELRYLSVLINVPYTTLYNYRHGRSRMETMPYTLVDKLSTVALCNPNAPNLTVTRMTHPVKLVRTLLEVEHE